MDIVDPTGRRPLEIEGSGSSQRRRPRRLPSVGLVALATSLLTLALLGAFGLTNGESLAVMFVLTAGFLIAGAATFALIVVALVRDSGRWLALVLFCAWFLLWTLSHGVL